MDVGAVGQDRGQALLPLWCPTTSKQSGTFTCSGAPIRGCTARTVRACLPSSEYIGPDPLLMLTGVYPCSFGDPALLAPPRALLLSKELLVACDFSLL